MFNFKVRIFRKYLGLYEDVNWIEQWQDWLLWWVFVGR